MSEIETVIAGLFIAICHAIGPERAERATDMVAAFIADPRTGDYERKLFHDLAGSIAEAHTPQPAWSVFERLATIH